MTTIAVNKYAMACDLQFTHSGGIKFKGKTKIIDLKPEVAKAIFGVNRAFIGFCGNADIWGEIVSWYDSPGEKLPKTKGIELLLLTDKQKIYHGTTLSNWMEICEPHFSIGSGMHLALSAMQIGATPKEAVKAAAKYDPNTGMGVKEYLL
jgi:hypothetical protein